MKKIMLAVAIAATALLSACNNGAPKANLKSDIDTISYEMGMVMGPAKAELGSYLAQQGSDSNYVDEFIKGYMEGMRSSDDKKQMAYNLGMQAGMQLKAQLPMIEKQVFQGDSTKKVSVKNFLAGFLASTRGKASLKNKQGKLVTKEEANQDIINYMSRKNIAESAQFMAKMAKQPGVKPLSKGVLYKELAKGGTEHVTALDSIIVKYEGRLANGQVFDSSAQQPGGTVTLSLKNVIPGWRIAIPAMPVGATWEIYIPADQAYGEQGSGPIPPHSALVFKITLVGKAK